MAKIRVELNVPNDCRDCEHFDFYSEVCNLFNNDVFYDEDYDRFLETYNRLSELEDKIENGTLVFIDEPFWSEYHDCWAVFQRTEDIVQTCYMTVNQAKDYKKVKEKEK